MPLLERGSLLEKIFYYFHIFLSENILREEKVLQMKQKVINITTLRILTNRIDG